MNYKPQKLRCEYFTNPLGIDEPHPRLSWQVASQSQTAYRILVATETSLLGKDIGNIWDSRRIQANCNTHIEYRGKSLKSRHRYFWKVCTWDTTGQISKWSEIAEWEMGLLKPSDWKATWIASSLNTPTDKSSPCPYLRREFTLVGKIIRARLYATAFGLYEMHLNGQRIGKDYFTPGWTDYAVRVQYQTYDVTNLLRQGDNVLGAILGDGWYCGYLVWKDARNHWGATPQLRAQLVLDFEDGPTEIVSSDESWRCATGPILESDIYNGEVYDARLEMLGWDQPGFSVANWTPVRKFSTPKTTVNASASPKVRKIQEIKPVTVTEPLPGTFVFDMGQNMVGWARLTVEGAAGTTVTLRFAEVLNPDGTLYTTSLRSARCTDKYVLKGKGVEVFEPHFTFHGFRYVEVTNYPGKPSLETIQGVVLHSDTPLTGTFECSNPMINQLQSNILWGQKGNFLDVPTDCPQRDERLGWTGDIQVFARTACYNADVAGFLTKWLTDLEDAQSPNGAFPMVTPDVLGKKVGDGGPAWADAAIIVPWTLYQCYGDSRILRRHYASMKKYLRYLDKTDYRKRHCFGDWLNINDDTAHDLIATAFHAHAAKLMVTIATTIGKKQDAASYNVRFKQIREAFNKEYVTPNGRLVNGSQTAYLLALHFDLLPTHLRKSAVIRLVQRIHDCKDHLSTGFVGTPYLLFTLRDSESLDLAYKILLNEDFPSWGYPIKYGATTMWERWDGWRHDKGFQDPAMNSFNHYAYGAVGDWMYRTIAGLDIDSDVPGYRRIRIQPRLGGGLTWAKASLETMNGKIESHWRIENGKFHLEVLIPGNTQATVILPSGKSHKIAAGRHQFSEGAPKKNKSLIV